MSSKLKQCPCCGRNAYGQKPPKYRNQKTKATVTGKARTFDSRGEANRAKALEEMQRNGEIAGLKFQPRVKLVPEADITYIPDFLYRVRGRVVCEDFKSTATRNDPVFKLKLRLWQWRGPVPLILTINKSGKLVTETIEPGWEPITFKI